MSNQNPQYEPAPQTTAPQVELYDQDADRHIIHIDTNPLRDPRAIERPVAKEVEAALPEGVPSLTAYRASKLGERVAKFADSHDDEVDPASPSGTPRVRESRVSRALGATFNLIAPDPGSGRSPIETQNSREAAKQLASRERVKKLLN